MDLSAIYLTSYYTTVTRRGKPMPEEEFERFLLQHI